jgi:hypothetical protein
LEDPGCQLTPGLLVDHMPVRQVIRHHSPRSARSGNVAQAIEHFSEWIHSLWGIFGN